MGFPKPKRVFDFDVSEYAPTYSLPPAYPCEARDKGLTGKGVAVVKIDPRNGYVTTASMLKSMGQEILDTEESLEDRLRGNALVPYL
jgi:outer membrane biosynthesis protein TonB